MRVLVTGCSGFLGGAVTEQLLARGDEVVGLSRRPINAALAAAIDHRRGDLTDRDFVESVFQTPVDAVIHPAAVAGIWGPWERFYRSNVVATRTLLATAQRCGVRYFVHTSSPSVTFDGRPQRGIDESIGVPERWLCHYPHTKAIAEREVLDANAASFQTVSLRPHLIWGPGDPHLVPRIVDRAAAGRLRIVGDGQNRVDVCHVQNAAAAHLNVLDALVGGAAGVAGKTFFITDGAPVRLWDWVAQVCRLHGVAPPTKRISYPAAAAIGAAMELGYRALPSSWEPPMTRFVAAQLAMDHWFDITAARDRLGYRPVGLDLPAGLRVEVTVTTAGEGRG